jgi:hypothetical protein
MSSTEAEFAGVDEVAPYMLWKRFFMQEQGLQIEESILNHDNLSDMLLETSWKEPSSKRMKYIRVRHFFIKDNIKSGDITLKHCPVTDMLGDHFTKPLQGRMFQNFRAEIQGIPLDPPDSDLGWDRDEERTENTMGSSTGGSPY